MLQDLIKHPRLAKPIAVMRVIYDDINRTDLLRQATAMAYVTLLSIVPSLAVVFVLIGVFSPVVGQSGGVLEQARGFILDNLAAGTGESVVTHLEGLIANLDLAKVGWSSFAGALVSLVLLLKQIETALNQVWSVRKARNLVVRFIYFWTFLTLGVFVASMLVGMSSGFRLPSFLSNDLIKSSVESVPTSSLTWLVTYIVEIGFFFLLYKIVPNCQVSMREAAAGGLLAGTLFHFASRFYGIFISKFANYQLVYGAIAAFPVFLMWLYICWLIILFGAVAAWRYGQGMPEETGHTIDVPLNAMDRLRNIHLQSIVPLVCMLAIYQRFAEAKGQGISGRELAVNLHLHATWVLDGLESLAQLGYIIESQPTTDHEGRYYPAIPPEKVKVKDLQARLAQPSTAWLKEWELDSKLKTALSKLTPETPSVPLSLAELVGA
jgi:membrane protein